MSFLIFFFSKWKSLYVFLLEKQLLNVKTYSNNSEQCTLKSESVP